MIKKESLGLDLRHDNFILMIYAMTKRGKDVQN